MSHVQQMSYTELNRQDYHGYFNWLSKELLEQTDLVDYCKAFMPC
jgi:hypothetical protein